MSDSLRLPDYEASLVSLPDLLVVPVRSDLAGYPSLCLIHGELGFFIAVGLGEGNI